MMKYIGLLLLGGVVIFGGFMTISILGSRGDISNDQGLLENNVTIVGNMQVVTITARGGYQPRQSIAQAGIPTVIKFDTNGTFDCSSSVRIPSMGISQILASTGTTTIDLGVPGVGKLRGSCSMGMYPFEIDFRN